MPPPPCPGDTTRLRAALVQAKEALAAKRDDVRRLHDLGLPPLQVCAKLTVAADAALQTLWNDALADFSESEAEGVRGGCALVAHGGYGRRHLAPHSDLDLMILCEDSTQALAQRLARRLTGDVFDLGLDLGHSLRTTAEAIQIARNDVLVATSLIESRHLVGSQALHESFFNQFSESLQRRKKTDAVRFVASRRDERVKFGETVFVLEPNVKKSRGALRDIHLLRWLWFLHSGLSDLDRLHAGGLISKFDHHRICSARDFMLRVRNDLHFSSHPPPRPFACHVSRRMHACLVIDGFLFSRFPWGVSKRFGAFLSSPRNYSSPKFYVYEWAKD